MLLQIIDKRRGIEVTRRVHQNKYRQKWKVIIAENEMNYPKIVTSGSSNVTGNYKWRWNLGFEYTKYSNW